MKKIKKGFLLLLIFGCFILSMGIVSASEYNSTEPLIEQNFQDDILNAPQEINITEKNYNVYFSLGGSLNPNSNVKPGDTLNLLGTFKNKNFRIDMPLNIVGASGCLLKDCSFWIENGASGSNLSNLHISNTNSFGIHISASNCSIDTCSIYTTGPSSYNIILDTSSHFNNITNSYLKAGSYRNSYEAVTYSVSNIVVGGANYNYIANNYLECDDANSIHLSEWGSTNFQGGISNYNTIYNNTIRCMVIPTSWCYGIKIYGKGNKIDSNTIIGTYRGISGDAETIIVNNKICNLTGLDYNTGMLDGAEYGIISGANSIIKNNQISDSLIANDAIYATTNSIVSENTINVKGKTQGIHVVGDNINVTDNKIQVTSGRGIYQDGAYSGLFIANNNITATFGIGILVMKISPKNSPRDLTIINNNIFTYAKYSINIKDVEKDSYLLLNNSCNTIILTPVSQPESLSNITFPIVNVSESFEELYNALKAVEDGGIINLTGNIVLEGVGSVDPVGFVINKTITIDGNNFIIDAQESYVRIFNITENANVTLRNLTISSSSFRGVGKYCMGAAIYNTGTLTIINSTFVNNKANIGGAIYNNGTLNITDSTFRENRAVATRAFNWQRDTDREKYVRECGGCGGAIFNDGILNINGSVFHNNLAEFSTGAIYNNGILNMDDCLIFSNKAQGSSAEGGVIYNSNNASINNTQFLGNKASQGGVIKNSNGTLIIENSELSQNIAYEDHFSSNGGVIVGNGIIKLINSNFTANSGGKEGGVINTYDENGITYTELTIDGCNFNDNVAGSGGVVYNFAHGNLNIINSNFNGNKAGDGSAVFNFYADMLIDGSTFTKNIATNELKYNRFVSGGTVSSNGANNVIVNSKFVNNINSGTGALNVGGRTVVDNSSFVSNSGKGTGGAITAQQIVITNTELSGNTARTGNGVYVEVLLRPAKGYDNGYFDEEGKYQLVRPAPPAEEDPAVIEDNSSNEEPSNPIDEPSFIESNTTNNDNPSDTTAGNSTNVDATPVGEIQNAISVSNEPSSSPSSDAQDSSSNTGSSEASSSGESKAYEISKSVLDNPQLVLSPIVLGLILLALVVIGYKRKSKDDY